MDDYRLEWVARARAGGAVMDAAAYERGEARLYLVEAPSEGIPFASVGEACDFGIDHDFKIDFGPALEVAEARAFGPEARTNSGRMSSSRSWDQRPQPAMKYMPSRDLPPMDPKLVAEIMASLKLRPEISIGRPRVEPGAVVYECTARLPELTEEQRARLEEIASTIFFDMHPHVVFIPPQPENDHPAGYWPNPLLDVVRDGAFLHDTTSAPSWPSEDGVHAAGHECVDPCAVCRSMLLP